jgi:putative transposase
LRNGACLIHWGTFRLSPQASGTPLSLEDARRQVEGYVEHYNNVRLNSAIGYITPKDMLAGHQQEIQAERDRKLDAAKEQRKNRRQGAA